jgi:flotillin
MNVDRFRREGDKDDKNKDFRSLFTAKNASLALGSTAVVGLAAFITVRYRVASPSQYVVRTGLGIDGVSISKKAVQWPFQKAETLSMSPHNFKFSLSAMSREKVDFNLPGVFTIGPNDSEESLTKYVTLLNGHADSTDDIIKGLIEGETRVLAASLDIEDIFNGRDKFRTTIIAAVQEELAKFGLVIYNANIKELEDSKGSEYFVNMRQRKLASAENQARRDIADAKYQGDIGVKEKERDTRIQTAIYEAEAMETENTRNAQVAKSTAEYQILQADYDRRTKLAHIESVKSAQIRESELLRELENRNVMQETERLRAKLLSQAIVEAEAKKQSADADLYTAQRKAEGVRAEFEAQAEGLEKLMSASPDPNTIIQYLMIDRNVLPALAAENAKAIQGLQPKITSWVTSGSSGADVNPIASLMKSLPPLVSTIYDQTGMRPPGWLMDTSEIQKKD